MREPRFGVHTGPENTTADDMVALWQRIERLGFGWISLWDHFWSLTGPGGLFEAVSTQTALACHTTTVRCGVYVYSVGYRHPAVLANAIASIDHYSHGRTEVGLGAGWAQEEYDAYGIPFPPPRQRLDMLEEGVQVLAGLLHDETTTFDGAHFSLRDASLRPPPVQARLPVWVGGAGEKRTLRIAARFADGWDAPLLPVDEWARKRRILHEHCEDVGRDPASISTCAHFAAAPDEASLQAQWRQLAEPYRAMTLVGSDDQVLDGIQRFVEAGADQVVLSVSGGLATEIVDWIADLLDLVAVPPS
jgi:alkanesulfonate monooxygenase SsuD/methylene tetrahydromethanopterin reductase-like flavin-dependent oxidoreductase (luciferase family)